jgi:hypothetical protein
MSQIFILVKQIQTLPAEFINPTFILYEFLVREPYYFILFYFSEQQLVNYSADSVYIKLFGYKLTDSHLRRAGEYSFTVSILRTIYECLWSTSVKKKI